MRSVSVRNAIMHKVIALDKEKQLRRESDVNYQCYFRYDSYDHDEIVDGDDGQPLAASYWHDESWR